MKSQLLLLISGLTLVSGFGCKPTSTVASTLPKDLKSEGPTGTPTLTALPMRDYSFAQKALFVAALQTEVTALKNFIGEFESKAKTLSEPAHADAITQLKALQANAVQIEESLVRVESATPSLWAVARADSERALFVAQEAMEKSRLWISKMMAPQSANFAVPGPDVGQV